MAAPAPVEDRILAEADLRAISTAFDPDFYRAVYTDLPAEMDALWHYRVAGWLEARDPATWFSTARYLEENPDVAAAGIEPFSHYLRRGHREGRDVRPSRLMSAYYGQVGWGAHEWGYPAFDGAPGLAPPRRSRAAGGALLLTDEHRAAIAAEFDAHYYLAVNPDVAQSGMDPLDHFLAAGWIEGRDPNARFSVRDYLADNPDVAATGVHPFAHYLLAGRAEGRAAKSQLGFRYDVIARLKPVEDRLADALAAAQRVRLDPPERLAPLADLGDLHITFSHDDYTAHSGGLQMCVRRESERFMARGVDHLHLFPAAFSPMVRLADEPGPLGVVLNGHRLGPHGAAAVQAALTPGSVGARRSFAIHSLLGHDPDATADILAAAGLSAGFFWLHDFASVCAGFHLLRNDVEDCAAPPRDSAACGVCAYGPFRARQEAGHRRLFDRLALTVVAPSQVTLDFWRAHTDLPARGAVALPHATLKPRGPAPQTAADRPLRVAYLGMPTVLKGWPVFRDLAIRLAEDPRYAFLHLGGQPDPSAPAAFHAVVATGDRPRAMQEAIEALEVDVALLWPLCRETFSFTAYEAAAGGAAVITGPDSGNVAAFASDPAIGRVLADEATLLQAFQGGEIVALSRRKRKARVFDQVYSGLSADLVTP
ncbi:MAG: hypothetical protein EPN98_13305 [Phenylobacterium sp.]|uniref:hypothetical protein n=1 Tax=Phenylobacterium sp. TaxID=1871053 RepID=UPI00121EDB95|nr:hypothetical protein [Phenylobacterium sp.]TAL32541.1 MAG: hypothetical protein EPN98_13305 [Phenylobacterium sp.]